MLNGFSDFIKTAYNAVLGFFSGLAGWFQRIIVSTRVEAKDGKVYCIFPDYASLVQEVLGGQGVHEATRPGDKGRQIASQIKQHQIVKKPLNPAQATELNDNVAKVAQYLGMAFESGIVIYLVEQKKIKLNGIGTSPLVAIKDLYNKFIGRVRDNYVTAGRSTATRENFIKLLQHNTAKMAEEIHHKSLELMKCKSIMSIRYIGIDNKSGENIAGADMILTCEDDGQMQYISTKYMSNPHSSISQKSPSDVHRMLGGKGNRNDEYYVRLTQNDPTPDAAAQHVLLDLWASLTGGHASTGDGSPTRMKLDGKWVGEMFSHLFDGDTMTKPAYINYALGQSTVGEFSPAMQRDFRTNRNGQLASKEGSYGEASLDGYAKYMTLKPGTKQPKMAIKIKYISPDTPTTRSSYIKIYVNPTDAGTRWAKYNVQIQANNLTTK
jgi:hypothetical protein